MSGRSNDLEKEFRRLEELVAGRARLRQQAEADRAAGVRRLRVNKRTHRVRFDNESGDSVEVVIEPLKPPSKDEVMRQKGGVG